jgi:hypothetical protein
MDERVKSEDSASLLWAINKAKTTRKLIEHANPKNNRVAWPAGNLMLIQPPYTLQKSKK